MDVRSCYKQINRVHKLRSYSCPTHEARGTTLSKVYDDDDDDNTYSCHAKTEYVKAFLFFN